MNKLKYISFGFLPLIFCFTLSLNASAQHSSRGGVGGSTGGNIGGGGGNSFGGGGNNYRQSNGGSSSRPGNGGSASRPGNGSNTVRPGNGSARVPNPTTFTPRNNGGNSRTNINIGINNRGGYGGYGGYNSYYRSNSYYNFYPRYSYRPIYYSPYSYSHYGPLFGFRLGILPFGYYPFYLGNDPYYYYDGIYYRPYASGGYEVTQPPLGATIKHLPDGAKETSINGQQYYELGGTFYQGVYNTKNKLQYVVVGTDGVINQVDATQPVAPAQTQQNIAPLPDQQLQQQQIVTANLSQLPANTKVVTIQQQKYYMAPSGVYYQEVIASDNTISYQPVGGLNGEEAPNNN